MFQFQNKRNFKRKLYVKIIYISEKQVETFLINVHILNFIKAFDGAGIIFLIIKAKLIFQFVGTKEKPFVLWGEWNEHRGCDFASKPYEFQTYNR